ncbi:MAG: MFS transporter [Chloroflexi bacterium]|nr:MFS transporter [Chloroflexota bacterium]
MKSILSPRWPARVFYGWWVVAATCVINALGGGVYFYGFTVFFLPLSRDLGLSRAATSLVFSLSRAEGAVEGPAAGYLIDRFGPRAMVMVGVVVMGVGYVLLSRVNGFVAFLLVYLGLISIAFNGGFSAATMAAVNNWFVRRRGLAMGISISAFGLGGALVTPLLAVGILYLGWRTTAALAGIVLMVVVVPVARLVHRSPESIGLRPDGDLTDAASSSRSGAVASDVSEEFTVREALRTPAYWVLAVGTMLRTGVLGTMVVHFVPIMVWRGVSEPTGAFLLAIMAFLSIPLRIALGWLGDKWSRPMMIAGGMALGVLALLLLQGASSLWQLWAFVAVLSVVDALSPLNWAIVGDFFGRRNFATLRGILGLVYSWGMVALPVVAGAIFDRTSSYTMAIWIFVGVMGAGAITFALLRRPRVPSRRSA